MLLSPGYADILLSRPARAPLVTKKRPAQSYSRTLDQHFLQDPDNTSLEKNTRSANTMLHVVSGVNHERSARSRLDKKCQNDRLTQVFLGSNTCVTYLLSGGARGCTRPTTHAGMTSAKVGDLQSRAKGFWQCHVWKTIYFRPGRLPAECQRSEFKN